MTTPIRIAACLATFALTATAPPPESPWFGTWKLQLARPDEKPETLVYSDAGNGAMRMESVEAGSILVTRFDGKPAADIGPGAGKGNALAIKALSPTRYRWTFLVAGTPRVEGINTLAPDRQSFRETSWRTGTPEKTITLIYTRQ